ncbi:hypothetical protein ACFL4C_02375 [Candidatus Omnitrophota bacterium]
MMEAFTRIQESQREWALQYKGRTKFTDYKDNLFEELKSDAFSIQRLTKIDRNRKR